MTASLLIENAANIGLFLLDASLKATLLLGVAARSGPSDKVINTHVPMPIAAFFNSPLHSTFRTLAFELATVWNGVSVTIFFGTISDITRVVNAVCIAVQ